MLFPKAKKRLPDETVRLSLELSRLLGKPLHAPSSAGELRTALGERFKWRKCPVHGTWLQPEWRPFPHWKCAASNEEVNVDGDREWSWRCEFMRPAKMRSRIERKLFAVMRAIEEE